MFFLAAESRSRRRLVGQLNHRELLVRHLVLQVLIHVLVQHHVTRRAGQRALARPERPKPGELELVGAHDLEKVGSRWSFDAELVRLWLLCRENNLHLVFLEAAAAIGEASQCTSSPSEAQ